MTTLPEELLLVSLDERGRPRNPRSALGPALAGAVLADLLISGHLAFAPDGTITVAAAPGGTGTGDPVLDKALDLIRAEAKPRKLKWWVTKLAGGPWRNDVVRREVIDDLTAEGVLTKGSLKVLGLFERAAHRPADPAAPERIRAGLRKVLLGDGSPDERLAALTGLVEVTGLVDACVGRDERKAARRRAKQIAAGEETSEAVRKVQEEVMAGVLAAVVASTAASAGATGGGS